MLANLYAEAGEFDSIGELSVRFPGADQREIRLALARAYRKVDKSDEAREILLRILKESPSFRPALDEIMRLLVQARDASAMVEILERWLKFNPNDTEIRGVLQTLLNQLERFNTPDESGL